ncbi:hypothetical protein DFQ27_007055 [Actinomortierella ambigua]|uniref:Zn(2)-C6 fungal-type domain-containing protein n=1 Tax=Actinomortierella ambigua TaxID=1343610 RepID=A0A9P6QJV0_9FUNG|nr:hypothetical protein DFQ27_007055 [Actinomortierella ambigua]
MSPASPANLPQVSFVNLYSEDPWKKRQRVRIQQACSECRRQKIKCDGQRPCKSCKKSDRSCVYASAPSHFHSSTASSAPGSTTHSAPGSGASTPTGKGTCMSTMSTHTNITQTQVHKPKSDCQDKPVRRDSRKDDSAHAHSHMETLTKSQIKDIGKHGIPLDEWQKDENINSTRAAASKSHRHHAHIPHSPSNPSVSFTNHIQVPAQQTAHQHQHIPPPLQRPHGFSTLPPPLQQLPHQQQPPELLQNVQTMFHVQPHQFQQQMPQTQMQPPAHIQSPATPLLVQSPPTSTISDIDSCINDLESKHTHNTLVYIMESLKLTDNTTQQQQPAPKAYDLVVEKKRDGLDDTPPPELSLPSDLSLPTQSTDLPSIEIRDHLVDTYFTYRYPVWPIVHKKIFIEQLNDPNSTPSLLLLNAMFAYASRYSNWVVLRADPTRPETAGQLFLERAQAMLPHFLMAPRLSTVQALLFLAQLEDNQTQRQTYHSMSVRMAQLLDLHKSCKHMGLPDDERETRRCIWWCCYMNDRLLALATRKPAIIHDGDCNIDFPFQEHLYDGPGSNSNSMVSLSHYYSPPQLFLQLLHLSKLVGRVLKHFTRVANNRYRTQEEHEVALTSLDESLFTWLAGLPEHLQYTPAPDALSTKTLPSPYVASLHMYFYSIVHSLHNPYMDSSNPRSTDDMPKTSLSHERCTLSASMITGLARSLCFQPQFGLNFGTQCYTILHAAIMHLTNTANSTAYQSLKSKSQFVSTLSVIKAYSQHYAFDSLKKSSDIMDNIYNAQVARHQDENSPSPLSGHHSSVSPGPTSSSSMSSPATTVLREVKHPDHHHVLHHLHHPYLRSDSQPSSPRMQPTMTTTNFPSLGIPSSPASQSDGPTTGASSLVNRTRSPHTWSVGTSMANTPAQNSPMLPAEPDAGDDSVMEVIQSSSSLAATVVPPISVDDHSNNMNNVDPAASSSVAAASAAATAAAARAANMVPNCSTVPSEESKAILTEFYNSNPTIVFDNTGRVSPLDSTSLTAMLGIGEHDPDEDDYWNEQANSLGGMDGWNQQLMSAQEHVSYESPVGGPSNYVSGNNSLGSMGNNYFETYPGGFGVDFAGFGVGATGTELGLNGQPLLVPTSASASSSSAGGPSVGGASGPSGAAGLGILGATAAAPFHFHTLQAREQEERKLQMHRQQLQQQQQQQQRQPQHHQQQQRGTTEPSPQPQLTPTVHAQSLSPQVPLKVEPEDVYIKQEFPLDDDLVSQIYQKAMMDFNNGHPQGADGRPQHPLRHHGHHGHSNGGNNMSVPNNNSNNNNNLVGHGHAANSIKAGALNDMTLPSTMIDGDELLSPAHARRRVGSMSHHHGGNNTNHNNFIGNNNNNNNQNNDATSASRRPSHVGDLGMPPSAVSNGPSAQPPTSIFFNDLVDDTTMEDIDAETW